jgi:hypothetical protein
MVFCGVDVVMPQNAQCRKRNVSKTAHFGLIGRHGKFFARNGLRFAQPPFPPAFSHVQYFENGHRWSILKTEHLAPAGSARPGDAGLSTTHVTTGLSDNPVGGSIAAQFFFFVLLFVS